MTTPTTLPERVAAFQCLELPGQPMSMHMGTSRLVNDLAKEVESLSASYAAREEEAHQLSERIIKLTKERDALAAAGKLALDALVAESRTTESNVTLAQILTAITALRQAVLA